MPPMRDGVPRKHSSMTSAPTPSASKICAPLYDASVLMPILAMVLRMPIPTPFANDLTRSSRLIDAGRRPSLLSANSASYARYGHAASAPYAMSRQNCCTSRSSPLSTTTPTRERFFSWMSAWCTRPVASSGLTGTRSGPAALSLNTTKLAPASTAASTCAAMRASASRSPAGPSATGKVVSTTVVDQPLKPRSALIAATSLLEMTGCGRSSRPTCLGSASVTSASGPMNVRSDVTTASRNGSIAGLVTCANSCLKYSNGCLGRWLSTASAASLPMEPSGSAPALVIGARMYSKDSNVYPNSFSC
mmetsp:Transcript_5879/g.18050  ORF Transcript_5879/g.18050 Transcript_5879/m.18050 type:complete len:305 (+) Transcript_5879:4025-4939(+)